jgi:hypothetical protein
MIADLKGKEDSEIKCGELASVKCFSFQYTYQRMFDVKVEDLTEIYTFELWYVAILHRKCLFRKSMSFILHFM